MGKYPAFKGFKGSHGKSPPARIPVVPAYNWDGDEGLDPDIDSTPLAFLDPTRASLLPTSALPGLATVKQKEFHRNTSAFFNIDSQIKNDPSSDSPNYLHYDTFCSCLTWFGYSLPWWLTPIIFFSLFSVILWAPIISSLIVLNPQRHYEMANYWLGTYEFWYKQVLPIAIFLEIAFFTWTVGKLMYRSLIHYTHGKIMTLSESSIEPDKETSSWWGRFIRSGKFQILVSSSSSILFTLYIAMVLILYSSVFTVPSYKEIESGLGIVYDSPVINFFIYRLILIFLVGCALFSIQKLFIVRIVANFYQTAYSERLQEYCFAFQSIKRLFEHALHSSIINHAECQSKNKLRKIYFERRHIADPEKPFSERPIKVPSIYHQIHYFVTNPIRADDFIDDRRRAKNTARVIFEHFYPNLELKEKNCATVSSLNEVSELERIASVKASSLLKKEHLQDMFTPSDLPKVYALFDLNHTGSVRPLDMKFSIVHWQKEKQRLIKSLKDHGQAVLKLNTIGFVSVIFFTIVLTPFLLGYAMGGLGALVTFILPCKFMFGDCVSNVIRSIIFLFVTHPFDVGDRVFISGETYFVHEMGLFCTLFHRFDSHLVYFPNSVLVDLHIVNIRRSSNMTEWIDLIVDIDTPKEKLNRLREKLSSFVLVESRDFEAELEHFLSKRVGSERYQKVNTRTGVPQKASVIEMCGFEIINSRLLRLGIALRHRSNFQNGIARANRHYKFMGALQEALQEIGIKYYPPKYRIQCQ